MITSLVYFNLYLYLVRKLVTHPWKDGSQYYECLINDKSFNFVCPSVCLSVEGVTKNSLPPISTEDDFFYFWFQIDPKLLAPEDNDSVPTSHTLFNK